MTCAHDRNVPGPDYHYSDGNHERCGHCGAVRARHFGLDVWGPWHIAKGVVRFTGAPVAPKEETP